MSAAGIKRTAFFALALVCAAFCACAKPAEPSVQPTEAPAYETMHYVRYWPEDADYDSCDYACVLELPVFSQELTAGYSINREIELYRAELFERIENDYMPSAITDPPYTEVQCEVVTSGEVTSIVFHEKHCHEAQPENSVYTLMLDGRGERINLCDLFLNYHAERMTAEAIAKRISGDRRYYQTDTDGILAFLDINHGAKATDTGCTVYIPEGKLAPYEEGVLEFDFTFDELAPDFVGDGKALTLEQYRRLTEFLAFAADGIVVRGDFIENGVLTAYAASSFMGELAQTLGIKPEAGRINIPEEQFLSLYRGCFGTEFPGIDTDAHDIKLEDGVYKVRSTKKSYRYNVDMLEAERNGSELVIAGELWYGSFGYAYTEFAYRVSIVLEENSASPYGFTLKEFGLNH